MRINGQPIYRGDARPVNLYSGPHKIAGWKAESKAGLDISFDGAYHDYVDLSALGISSQATTVQGKNLLDRVRNTVLNLYVDGTTMKILPATGMRSVFCPVTAGNTYTITKSRVTSRFIIGFTGAVPAANVAVLSIPLGIGPGNIFATAAAPAGARYVAIFYWHASEVGDEISIQVELGSSSTPIVSFVPTSPSPDYPSPVISSACGVRARDQAGARHADVAIPVLRAVPDGAGGWLARDSVETVDGRLIHRRRVDPAIDAHVTASIVGASQYVLASPVETDIGAALPSYYPCTRVLVSGDAPPEVTAACRVVDGA